MGGLAVIRQQEEALGVLVQPSHRKEAQAAELRGQEVQNGLSPPVLRGGEDPAGLVHHEPGELPVTDVLPVHGDGGGGGVVLLLHTGGGAAVHQHPALLHQKFCLPAAPLAGGGQDLVQPLHLHALLLSPAGDDFFWGHYLINPREWE